MHRPPRLTWGIGPVILFIQGLPALEHTVRQPVMFVTAVACLNILGLSSAPARDNGQWENSPPHIRQWFQGLKQPDHPTVSCCGEADAYEADIFEVEADHYVAVITDGKGEIPNGTKILVPNHKIKWDEGNPTGHGIIFMGSQGQVLCYVAPGGV
jgi:hypothetical protein